MTPELTIEKICIDCGGMFPLNMFHRNKSTKSGVNSYCKACATKRSDVWQKQNKDRVNAKNAKWLDENSDKVSAKSKEYRRRNYVKNAPQYRLRAKEYAITNPEKVKARKAKWDENNKAKIAETNRAWRLNNIVKATAKTIQYRKCKEAAKPKWANEFFMQEAYSLAKLRNKVCGGTWHVDHIVPIRSKLVCGLHTHENLRVVLAKENQHKGNRYWPDMP